MTSEADHAFVWTWLPGAEAPVVAARLDVRGDRVVFTYGRSYLARPEAIALGPDLPLRAGPIEPEAGLRIAGTIDDGGPDGWGQRVILNRVAGAGPLTFLLRSGSDRFGALDFQASSSEYVPRGGGEDLSLEHLLRAADLIAAGEPLPAALEAAVDPSSSAGGARPKAIVADPRPVIAKFAMARDPFAIVKGEWVAMRLAGLAGLDVAPVELADAGGRDVLLVDRFDRTAGGGQRRQAVSALTLLGLDEMHARWASYAELSQILRQRSAAPVEDRRELFARITFNILVGNTDDHARNHAAFWDGESLRLAPAYDICPYPRSGGEATQGMIIGADDDPFRFSQVAGCVARCGIYGLPAGDAAEIVDRQIEVIRTNAGALLDEAGAGAVDRTRLSAVFLHPYALEGWRAR